MELVKIILKRLGGREIEQIFKNYFLLSLLLKQVVVSFFVTPADNMDIFSISVEKEQISGDDVVAESSGENCDLSNIRLMLLLAQLDAQPTTTSDKEISKNK